MKYKVGDILKWESNVERYAIDEIVSISDNSYKLKVIINSQSDLEPKVGECHKKLISELNSSNFYSLATNYIKEKEFNKDLKNLIGEE